MTNFQAPDNFLIRADRIPPSGLIINEEMSEKCLTELLSQPREALVWSVLKPAKIELTLIPEADVIHAKGHTQVLASCPCVRCMKDVQFLMSIDLNLRLMAPGQEDEETSLEMEFFAEDAQSSSDDELATSYYREGIVDVMALLREQLFLDLPIYPACDHPSALEPSPCDPVKTMAGDAEPWRGGRLADLAKWRNRLPKN